MVEMKEILSLSVTERIYMIEQIWNSINKESIPTSFAQEDELDHRLDRYRRNETNFFTWEEIKKDIPRLDE